MIRIPFKALTLCLAATVASSTLAQSEVDPALTTYEKTCPASAPTRWPT